MRRKTILTFCVVLALIVTLAFLLFTRRLPHPFLPTALQDLDPATKERVIKMTDHGRKPENFNLALVLTPIEFFGKVVDQNEAPIEGADITLTPTDSLIGSTMNLRHLKSDANGFFSITDLHGVSLGVDVRKDGYYRPEKWGGKIGWSAQFDYPVDLGRGRHIPRKDSPVIFHLYKPTQTEALIHTSKNCQMPKDGSPVIFDLGRSANGGSLRVQCRSWTRDEERDENRHYDWGFEVKIIDGGLVERVDKFAFIAPDAGYRESDSVKMSRSIDSAQWDPDFNKDYFVKFNNGVYGRFFVGFSSGGWNGLDFVAEMNPKHGSRNLEAKPIGQ